MTDKELTPVEKFSEARLERIGVENKTKRTENFLKDHVDFRVFWSEEDNCFIAQHNKEKLIICFGPTLKQLSEEIEACAWLMGGAYTK